MTLDQLLIGSFAAINILAFGLILYDKRKSRRERGGSTKQNRIPEAHILPPYDTPTLPSMTHRLGRAPLFYANHRQFSIILKDP